MSGKQVNALCRNFPEGLLVAVDRELDPEPDVLQAIGILALKTMETALGSPLELTDSMQILIPAEPSDDPDHYQWDINPERGQFIIRLPERGRSAVRNFNSSLLQTAAAGALQIELTRRLTHAPTNSDLNDFAAAGVQISGQILEEHKRKVIEKTGGEININLLSEVPRITGYCFGPISKLFGNRSK